MVFFSLIIAGCRQYNHSLCNTHASVAYRRNLIRGKGIPFRISLSCKKICLPLNGLILVRDLGIDLTFQDQ